jgi:hypothetical protein
MLEDGVSQIDGGLAEELRSFPVHSNISQLVSDLIHLSPYMRGDEGLIGLNEIHNCPQSMRKSPARRDSLWISSIQDFSKEIDND